MELHTSSEMSAATTNIGKKNRIHLEFKKIDEERKLKFINNNVFILFNLNVW